MVRVKLQFVNYILNVYQPIDQLICVIPFVEWCAPFMAASCVVFRSVLFSVFMWYSSVMCYKSYICMCILDYLTAILVQF